MSAQRPAKPRIAIMGAGNLAGALAVSLSKAGYAIEQIISRGNAVSMRRARRLAGEVGASAAAVGSVRIDADIVWFCVPDAVISSAAASLEAAAEWRGKIALHSSGALTSDELAVLRGCGAAVASVHPLMTFVRRSRPPLEEVPFAIEGDRTAVRAARKIVKHLGGNPFPIRKQEKAAYHAWGTFASPLLTSLLVTSERVAGSAGIKGREARRRMLPILRQTLSNYAKYDAAGAFSGPIVRGDADTVMRHLRSLRAVPTAREVYISLAGAALAYLPAQNKTALEKVLKSSARKGGATSVK